MKGRTITNSLLKKFREHLIIEERSAATVEKYCRDVSAFADYVSGSAVTNVHR